MKQQKDNIDEIDRLLYDYFEKNDNIPEKTAKVISKTPHRKKIRNNLSSINTDSICFNNWCCFG